MRFIADENGSVLMDELRLKPMASDSRRAA
jgi:hypothetical protein